MKNKPEYGNNLGPKSYEKIIVKRSDMKIKDASITILVGAESTTIEIRDNSSSITFCRVKLTASQLSQVLSRLSHVDCEAEVFGLDKINKKREHKPFVFEIPKGMTRHNTPPEEIDSICVSAMISEGLTEWESQGYYGSQTSFFEKDGNNYARVTILRWT